jgi:hypothetical protein
MKKLLLKAVAVCALLLPLQTVDAKTFGTFKPKMTFTLEVTEKISGQVDLSGKVIKPGTVDGVPNYKKGDKIKFKIGKKGQLTGPDGLSLPFKQDAGTANVYFIPPSRDNPSGDIGQVYKNAKNKPIAASLTFFKVTIKNNFPTTQTVVYSLE